MHKIKLLLLTLLLLISAVCLYADPLKTGSQVTVLPSPLYLDDSNKTLSEFLGEKYVVLFIWEMNNAALTEFYSAANLAIRNRDAVNFIGIGIGPHDQLKRFPGAVRLGFPVNSDHRGAAKALFQRPGDPMPLAVLLDKNGVLLWRGRLQNLQAIINSCKEGKFDLQEQIRLEDFSAAVNAAISENKFEDALNLLAAEYANHPNNIDLLQMQMAMLLRLDRRDDAFALLHQAQQRAGDDYRYFEIEYKLIGELNLADNLPDFFSRVKTVFAKKPNILIAFALAECQLPPEKLNLTFVLDLAAAGWQSGEFVSPEHRGLYALDYASILHSIGRNDLAIIIITQACEDLKDNATQLPRAQAALTYYTKMNEIAPTVTLPDLKK